MKAALYAPDGAVRLALIASGFADADALRLLVADVDMDVQMAAQQGLAQLGVDPGEHQEIDVDDDDWAEPRPSPSPSLVALTDTPVAFTDDDDWD